MIVCLVLVRSIQYCNCDKPFSVRNILFERLSFSIKRGKVFRIDCSGNEPDVFSCLPSGFIWNSDRSF